MTAQTPPTAPAKPRIVKPVAPAPPVVQRATPASSAKTAVLQDELTAVDIEIGKPLPQANGEDALSQLNEQDSAYLKSLMTKKGALENLISETMKAASDAGKPVVGSQKGS
jgi:hypothetical protein